LEARVNTPDYYRGETRHAIGFRRRHMLQLRCDRHVRQSSRGNCMELTDYLRIMRQRWVTIVLVILIAVAASAAITWQMTPKYESTARLFITTPQSETNEAYQGGMFSQQRVKSYVN